ncbi:MAG: replication initiation protein [Alphaproteobacteria bacterium]|nr:replication initiation protein [Alphaproteobacteria bacterium]
MPETDKKLRTIEVEPDEISLIKPGELIDIVELSPLTLQDRRIYNLLILNAWGSIGEPKEHRIHKRDLRGTHNVNDRVGESIMRLMGAIAQVSIEREDGKSYTRRVQLLSSTDEAIDNDGLLYYSFTAGLRAIIKQSSQFARLQKDVMYSFSSKYALALYEMVQKRGNLKYKTSEEFTLDRFRALLGVDKGKLTLFKNLKLRAIDPAVLEVNGLGEFGCKVEPIYEGRKVTGIDLSWWQKNVDEKKAALREVRISRVGRKARLRGTVEHIAPAPPRIAPAKPVTPLPRRGHSGLKESQVGTLRAAFPGTDIDEMERQFVAWNEENGVTPDSYMGALYGFIKKKLDRENDSARSLGAE